MIAFAADNIRVPALWVEDMLEGGDVALDEFATAMFVIDAAPPVFADVGLVADDFCPFDDRAVLDARVDQAGFVVAGDAEQAAEFEVAVFFGGGEVGVGGDFCLSVTGDDDAILHRPHLGECGVDGFPSVESFAIKN